MLCVVVRVTPILQFFVDVGVKAYKGALAVLPYIQVSVHETARMRVVFGTDRSVRWQCIVDIFLRCSAVLPLNKYQCPRMGIISRFMTHGLLPLIFRMMVLFRTRLDRRRSPSFSIGVFTRMRQQHIHCQRSVQHALQVSGVALQGCFVCVPFCDFL